MHVRIVPHSGPTTPAMPTKAPSSPTTPREPSEWVASLAAAWLAPTARIVHSMSHSGELRIRALLSYRRAMPPPTPDEHQPVAARRVTINKNHLDDEYAQLASEFNDDIANADRRAARKDRTIGAPAPPPHATQHRPRRPLYADKPYSDDE